MSFGKPHKAVAVSSFCTLLAAFAFAPLYSELVADQSPPKAISDLQYGRHRYVLRLVNGGCAGWMNYELDYDGAYSLLVDGEIFYSLYGEQERVEYRAGAGFNSLNQLSGSTARVLHKGNEYRFGTEGVSEMKLTFEGMINGKGISLAHKVRGPIELYEARDGEYLIRSESFPTFEEVARNLKTVTPFKPVLPFEVVAVQDDTGTSLADRCRTIGYKPIVLDEIFKAVRQISSQVLNRI